MKKNKKIDKPSNWIFYPVKIIVQDGYQSIINKVVDDGLKDNKGIFSNVTDISKECDLDAFLMIDAFDLHGSLIEYKDNLEAHSVIGNKGFLNEEFTYFLFATVSSLAKYIAANTDRPAGTKNHIIDTLKELDRLPVWGLFFQILILQGLCTWLEGMDITEQDRGFKAAQSLYDWIFERLMEKEIYFCYTPYSDNDKKILKPFCDYLYSTYAGKTIQKLLHERTTQRATDTLYYFKSDLTNDEVKELFDDLIKGRYLDKKTTFEMWGFVCGLGGNIESQKAINWIGNQYLLAYFIDALFGCHNSNVWIITENTFTIKGKAPNIAAMKSSVSKIKKEYYSTYKLEELKSLIVNYI